MTPKPSDLLQGTLDLLILKTLSWGPAHGYAVARWIQQLTGAVLTVGEGSLYPALHRLEERGWVETEWRLSEHNRRAKFYTLTAKGRQAFAKLNQEVSGLELELLGDEGLRYDDWTMRRPTEVDFTRRSPGYRYLRAKGNSIEGGTSEILRNIIAERVLGLPGEIRVDKDVAWKDLPK